MELEIIKNIIISDTQSKNRFSNNFFTSLKGSSSKDVKKNFILNDVELQVFEVKDNSKFPINIFEKSKINIENVVFIYIIILNKDETKKNSSKFSLFIESLFLTKTTEFSMTNCQGISKSLIIDSVDLEKDTEAEILIYLGA